MAVVLPESMDKLNLGDVPGSLSTIERYIGYMQERLDFAMRNMTKTVSAAGVSNAEVYLLITEIGNQLSALTSVVNSMSGSVTALEKRVADLENAETPAET